MIYATSEQMRMQKMLSPLILPHRIHWIGTSQFCILFIDWPLFGLTSLEDLCMAKTVKKASAKPKAAAKPRKTAAKKTNGNGIVEQTTISHEEVALLAHRFWTERGQQPGSPEDDWLRAEQTLLQRAS
jgi:Protein of unknown function (DUF2934)